jgi:hypothetical protein
MRATLLVDIDQLSELTWCNVLSHLNLHPRYALAALRCSSEQRLAFPKDSLYGAAVRVVFKLYENARLA